MRIRQNLDIGFTGASEIANAADNQSNRQDSLNRVALCHIDFHSATSVSATLTSSAD